MIHAQGQPIWLAVLDVDTGDVLGVTTSHVIGKLDYLDPAPTDLVEPEGPKESFGFEDRPGVGFSTPTISIQKASRSLRRLDRQVRKRNR